MIEFIDLPSHEQLEREWLDLESRSDPSFFTSWSWIGCWLASLPSNIEPRLLRVIRGEEVVGMGLLVFRHHRLHHLFPVKSLYLHATGDPTLDDIIIEHNGFLVDRTRYLEVVPQMLEYLVLQASAWEELHLNCISNVTESMIPSLDGLRLHRLRSRNHYVELEKVRSGGGDYLSQLGQNTRYNIRRSMKEYAKQGEVTLTVAENLDAALEYYAELKRLHQTYWRSRGLPGAFANSFLDSFHERLIRTRFAYGEIQLMCVHVGARALGYLYNFIQRGKVHNYQSGFDYAVSMKKNRPGLVMHSLAIEYNASCGHEIYDFLVGDSDYKQALGTHSGELDWIVLRRDRFKFRLEDGLRTVKRHFSNFRKARTINA